jgi:CO/xanthine dehydrogenase FAD-binding subunit
MREFEYAAPTTIDEALAALRSNGGTARPLAGGTDLVIQMKESATRFPYPSSVVNLMRVPELAGIEFDENQGLRIGATATMTDIAEHHHIRDRYEALAEGAGIVGSVQTMNLATIGGNLCNAAPSADTAPPLLALDASCQIAGHSGRRSVSLTEFFRGPGETVLDHAEILTQVTLPLPPARTGSAFSRHTPRKQMDIAVVGVAAVVTIADEGTIDAARIALGAVAPTPVRARKAEASLAGKPATSDTFAAAAEIAAGECSPISDIRGSAEFRRHLVRVMTERMLAEALRRAGG